MSTPLEALRAIIDGNLARSLPAQIGTLADIIRMKHDPGVVAVLVYGSCLRDTPTTDSVIDYYVLVDDAAAISSNPLSQLLCRAVPPNVYYAEETIDDVVYRAKYAVLTLKAFEHKVSQKTRNPYFWARFAQPAGLAYCRDLEARDRVAVALTVAVRTMLSNISSLVTCDVDALELWSRGLVATYQSELRSEGPDRARRIVEADAEYYHAVTEAVLGADRQPVHDRPGADWRGVQRIGRVVSVLRLIKAAFTFRGGADYLAWKISRHSGQRIELTRWQRRHPILASVVLLPRLLKSGAVK